MTEEFELDLKTSSGPAQLKLSRKGRTYTVTHFEVRDRPELTLAFSPKGAAVEDLDGRSDAAQCFGVSTKVRYGFVILGNSEMRANSIEELTHALKQVKVTPFNHEEI